MKAFTSLLLVLALLIGLVACYADPSDSSPPSSTRPIQTLPTKPTTESVAGTTVPQIPPTEPTLPDHVHQWQDATCTTPQTCLNCGQTQGDPAGHRWLPVTATTPKTCDECGLIDSDVAFLIPENSNISITDDDCFPKDTIVTVVQANDKENMLIVMDAMQTLATKYKAWDFKATQNGTAVQPQAPLTVTFGIPNGFSDQIDVFYISPDGTLELLPSTVDPAARTVTTQLTHFSLYALVDCATYTHDHTYISESIDPTCTDDGYTIYRCECGDYFYADKIPATGHSSTSGTCEYCGEWIIYYSKGLEFRKNYYGLGDSKDTYVVTGMGTCTDIDLVIPREYLGVPVTGILLNSLDDNITSLYLPDTIVGIGGMGSVNTYYFSKLKQITVHEDNAYFSTVDGVLYNKDQTRLLLYPKAKTDTTFRMPDTVTSMSMGIFYQANNLQHIILSDSLTEIPEDAFGRCENLTCVDLCSQLTCIGNNAFSQCSKLQSITIPDGVTEIPFGTFGGCTSLTSVTFGKGVRVIQGYAFNGCNALTDLTLPKNLESLDVSAFYGCTSLISIQISPDNPNFCTENSILYSKDKTTLILYPATKQSITFTVPDQVDTISFGAFLNNESLQSISLPAGLKYIENEAFAQCTGLQEITLPNGLIKLGMGAFGGCTSLTSITIPDSVIASEETTIFQATFSGCTSLETVHLGSGIQQISRDAFRGCTSLREITIPASVKEMYYCFEECENLQRIIFQGKMPIMEGLFGDGINTKPGVTCIATFPANDSTWNRDQCLRLFNFLFMPDTYGSGYYSKNLEYVLSSDGTYYILTGNGTCKDLAVVVPATYKGLPVRRIQENAFEGQTFDSLILPDSLTHLSKLYTDSGHISNIRLPDHAITFGDFALSGFFITQIMISEQHMDYIKTEQALYTRDMKTLVFFGGDIHSFTVPDSIFHIADFAFARNRIGVLQLPDGLQTIGEFAFSGCYNLSSINIPDSITTIHKSTFLDSDNLLEIRCSDHSAFCFENGILYDNPTTQILWVCRNISGHITIRDGVTTIDDGAFSNLQKLASITLPDSVTSIGANAFMSCTKLENVTFSANLLRIGDSAFASCSRLTQLQLPEGLTAIDEGAFYGCSGLESASLPNSVTSIGAYAFAHCYHLKSIMLPAGLTSIEEYTFAHCYRLTEVTIPASVKQIGEMAFHFGYDDPSAITIRFLGTIAQWNAVKRDDKWCVAERSTSNGSSETVVIAVPIHCTDGTA